MLELNYSFNPFLYQIEFFLPPAHREKNPVTQFVKSLPEIDKTLGCEMQRHRRARASQETKQHCCGVSSRKEFKEHFIDATDNYCFREHSFSFDTRSHGAGKPVRDQFAGNRLFHEGFKREWHELQRDRDRRFSDHLSLSLQPLDVGRSGVWL